MSQHSRAHLVVPSSCWYPRNESGFLGHRNAPLMVQAVLGNLAHIRSLAGGPVSLVPVSEFVSGHRRCQEV